MNLHRELEAVLNIAEQIPSLINGIPIAQLFIAGVFAVIMTEFIKHIIGLTESSIGFHNPDGELIKARTAAFIYSIIILLSNVFSYVFYQGTKQIIPNVLNQFMIDVLFVLFSIIGVWFYLKTVHYYRG